MEMGCCDLVKPLFATPFYGPASNAISHGHVHGLMGLAFNKGELLDTKIPDHF